MAVIVKDRRNRDVVLLNPAEKARKYADELANDVRITNSGMVVTKKNGKPRDLRDTQKAYRAGYLASRRDSANCFKAIQKKQLKKNKK